MKTAEGFKMSRRNDKGGRCAQKRAMFYWIAYLSFSNLYKCIFIADNSQWFNILMLNVFRRASVHWRRRDGGKELFPIARHAHLPIAAGWMAKAVDLNFRGFPVCGLWGRKRQTMKPPQEHIEVVCRRAA